MLNEFSIQTLELLLNIGRGEYPPIKNDKIKYPEDEIAQIIKYAL
jgi:hypothetical protein